MYDNFFILFQAEKLLKKHSESQMQLCAILLKRYNSYPKLSGVKNKKVIPS